MDLKLKQRMIGAVILIALAIIVLPILLDGDEQERLQLTRHMPPPPEVPIEHFDPGELRAEMEQIEAASSEAILARGAQSNEEANGKTPGGLDSDGLPIAWSLQVGSFKSEENAVKLRDELRDRGYQSYRLQVDTDEGPVSRVLVGPMLQRARLEEIQKKVERDMGLAGKIVRYDPLDDRHMVGG